MKTYNTISGIISFILVLAVCYLNQIKITTDQAIEELKIANEEYKWRLQERLIQQQYDHFMVDYNSDSTQLLISINPKDPHTQFSIQQP
ncbi:MAG: hypothetical protein ACO1HP_15015 [Bacteroidota bacterium]